MEEKLENPPLPKLLFLLCGITMHVYIFYCSLISNGLSLVKQHFGCMHELKGVIWLTATCMHSTQRNKLSQTISNSTPITTTQITGSHTRAGPKCPGEHVCLTTLLVYNSKNTAPNGRTPGPGVSWGRKS